MEILLIITSFILLVIMIISIIIDTRLTIRFYENIEKDRKEFNKELLNDEEEEEII